MYNYVNLCDGWHVAHMFAYNVIDHHLIESLQICLAKFSKSLTKNNQNMDELSSILAYVAVFAMLIAQLIVTSGCQCAKFSHTLYMLVCGMCCWPKCEHDPNHRVQLLKKCFQF
jgi:hypothetical protein